MELEDPDIIVTEAKAEDSDTSNASFSTTIVQNLTALTSPIQHPSDPPRIPAINPNIPNMVPTDTKIPGFNPFNNVTILKKGTFHEWKANIVTAFNAARLTPFVLTDQPLPDDPTKREEHIVKDYQALSVIQTTVDSEHFQLVANAQSAPAAFLCILAQYDDSGGLSTAMIFSDLVSLRLDEGGSLSDHLHRFRTLHKELTSNMMGTPELKISEAFIAILVLKSLPNKYSAIVQTTLASFESIKLARIYTILAMEANRSAPTSQTNDSALAANAGPSHPKPPKQKNRDVKCSLGHLGHTDEQCKVRRFREMEKDLAELKKEKVASTEKAKAAISTEESHYWEAAFTCHTSAADLNVIADTGSSSHMFRDKTKFDYLKASDPISISVASTNGAITASQRGHVTMDNLSLPNVIYSDKLSSNLISVGKLCDDGHVAVFRSTEGAILSQDGKTVLRLTRDPSTDKLWHPVSRISSHSALVSRTDKPSTAQLWHRRLGHLHPDGVIHFLKHFGNDTLTRNDFSGCDDCAQGKSYQTSATSPFHRSPRVLDLVHSDLLGPIHPPTRGGKKYILSFIDDHTRYNHIYLLASKDKTPACFTNYKALVERQTGEKIGVLKTDWGGEYSSLDFLRFLEDEGIETERGPANRPPANSGSERFFRTLLGRMRTQLVQSGLPQYLWGELEVYCNPSRVIEMNIPILKFEEQMKGRVHPFKFERLRPFGCLAFAHQQNRPRKLDPTSKRLIFIGVERGARAARPWDADTGRVLVSGDVQYREDIFPSVSHLNAHTTPTPPTHISLTLPFYYTDTPNTSQKTNPPVPSTEDANQPSSLDATADAVPAQPPDPEPNPPTEHPPDSNTLPASTDTKPQPRRTTRMHNPVTRYGFSAQDQSSAEHDHPSYSQAMKGPERGAWKQACREEFESLLQHNVGTLVDAPPGANVLGGMWRLSRKGDKHNQIVRYKARWVAFGNHQVKGLDYDMTYASVGSANSLRVLISMVAGTDWTIWQFDVETAFLNGEMLDTVYVRQVLDFEHASHPRRVWLLNQSLYGTKQAARCWQQHLNSSLAKFNLHPCTSDSAVYILRDERGTLILHTHIDDSLLFCSNVGLLHEFQAFLDSQYRVKWNKKPSLYLGIILDIQPNHIDISQSQYIESKLDEFSMSNCSPAKSPFPPRTILTPGSEDEIRAAADLPYQSLVGSLQWLAHTTRPNISYVVSQLSSFNASWTIDHWTKAKHVLRYLRHTQDQRIRCDSSNKAMSMYSDFDFSQCQTTRRSITGYVATMGGGAVSWLSQRQKVVALSTTEAEYMACADAARHISWLRSFLFDVFCLKPGPTILYVDNTSAIENATNEGIKSRSKHIDRRHHFIRELVEDGRVEIKQISTKEMLADHLTKPLSPQGLKHAMSLNNVCFGA